jgi:SH3-like domain-containing protein
MTRNYLRTFKILVMIFTMVSGYYSNASNFKEYFVYLKSNEVNLRTGPSKKYPIKWVIKHPGEPLRVIAKFEQWIKVRDIDEDEGWVMDAFASPKLQGGIIVGSKLVTMYKRPVTSSQKIARLEQKVRVKVNKCIETEWCSISIKDFKGWVPQKYLWGI